MTLPRSGDKRNAILAAATDIIAEQGLSAATAKIARPSGVPHPRNDLAHIFERLGGYSLSKEAERSIFMSKIWLVTGSASGLGRNIAEAVARIGRSPRRNGPRSTPP